MASILARTRNADAALAALPIFFGGAIAATRTLVGIAFGRHACRTVFNRVPPRTLGWLRPLLRVTRPLELLWRALTSPLRVAGPDVMLLGEVRCGTTTLASLLRSELGMVGPFTPWEVPLANDKESFFFAGHYFGCMAPRLYALCFPLRLRRWLERIARRVSGEGGRPPLIFDGCASHLSAPWAPALVSRLQAERMGGRPILFIVCVREPVSQHLSWWRLEQASMTMAKGLGLGDEYHQAPTRVGGYPPASLADAIALSRSPEVVEAWKAAEAWAEGGGAWPLPAWALPYPNGQLSAFDRFGNYAATLERWFSRFGRDAFVLVSLDQLSREPGAVVDLIASKCEQVLGSRPERRSERTGRPLDATPVLNAAPPLPAALEPDAECLRALGKHYRPLNAALFELIGRDPGWHEDEAYWWYR